MIVDSVAARVGRPALIEDRRQRVVVYSEQTAEEMRTATVHPGLERLIDDPAHRPLLETLEVYLDLAGNAHATADRMNLHRTSLYYRLQRIEHLANTDLRDGNERLCLHLALKLARLAGRYRPATAAVIPTKRRGTSGAVPTIDGYAIGGAPPR